jgi:hypothetical protein
MIDTAMAINQSDCKPNFVGLKLLVSSEISLDKNFEGVADDLRVLVTECADALL